METALNAVLVLLTVLHTVVLLAYSRLFVRGPEGIARVASPLLLATVVSHGGYLGLRGIAVGVCPLSSWDEIVSVVAFSICATYLLLEFRVGVRSTGVFAVVLAFVLHLTSVVAALSRSGTPTVELGVIQSIHIFAAAVGLSAVGLCGVYGILYLFHYAGIKWGEFGLFYRRMPSLDVLSRLNYVATWTAFIALSISLGVGYWEYQVAGGQTITTRQPMVIMTLVLWILYGSCLLAWRFLGLGGKRLAYTTVVGFLLMVVILCGTLLSGTFHG